VYLFLKLKIVEQNIIVSYKLFPAKIKQVENKKNLTLKSTKLFFKPPPPHIQSPFMTSAIEIAILARR